MTTCWDPCWAPSTAASNWPQRYQVSNIWVNTSVTQRKKDTIVTDNDCASNNVFGYNAEVNDMCRPGETTTSAWSNDRNIKHTSSSIASAEGYVSDNTFDACKLAGAFITEKPPDFNPSVRKLEIDFSERLSSLLDLVINVTPYSWQTESPLADRSDEYLDREIHDHFMRYDIKKNHCVACGFQAELEQL